jgi:hypothetical protein
MRRLLANLILLSLVISVPAVAARTRAVVHPAGQVSYSSTVVDAVTGKPVVGAEVVNQGLTTTTNATGVFTIPVNAAAPTTLTIRRSGYDTITVTVQAGLPPSPIRMQPHAGITVKLKTGQTVQIDSESAQLAYSIPLLTSIHSTTAALCKDGTQIEVELSTFARVSNVARASGAACCHIDTIWFDLEQKGGDRSHVALSYDCLTYDCFLGGRDHDTYQMVYLKFEDISEVVFE